MNPGRTAVDLHHNDGHKDGNSDDSNDVISEMAIVDTFTRLIFGEQGEPSPSERLIIDTFRDLDANVLLDSPEAMGEYLRALGVSEMIHLVASIHAALAGDSRCHAAGAGREATMARHGAIATRH